jgi:hypothetical protein
MAGGGRGRGVARQEGKEHTEVTLSRKRKRGQSTSDAEEEDVMALDEPNGAGVSTPDEKFPELGILSHSRWLMFV